MQVVPREVAGLGFTQFVSKRGKPFLSSLDLPLFDGLLHLPKAERIEMPLRPATMFLSDHQSGSHPLFGSRRTDCLPRADRRARDQGERDRPSSPAPHGSVGRTS